MAQWLEHSPPTNVARVQFLDPASYDCGLSLLLVLYSAPRGFSLGTPVPPPRPPQKPTFQIPIPSWNAQAFQMSSCELLGALQVNKLQLNFFV